MRKTNIGPETQMGVRQEFAIVADQQFILAIREVGYEGPAHAIAELIDNSIQAQAKMVAKAV